MSLRVETLREPAAFAGLRREWSALLAASPADGFFLTWEWLYSWWSHLSEGRRLALVTVRRGGELLALAPLHEREDLLGGTRLECLGTGRAGSDHLDVIVRSGAQPEVVALLARHLAAQGAVLKLGQLREDGAAAALAAPLAAAGFGVRTARVSRCPFIDLRGLSWDAYLAGLGREHRANFRRRLRRLEREHAPQLELVTSEARRRELLPVLFDLHGKRWAERGGSDGLFGPGLPAFHEQVSRLALEQGWLRLFVLWLSGTPAAALYCFRYAGVFSFYQCGFDPRFAKLGVGLVALGLAIRSATLEGAAEFDLLHGEEPYKFHWARRARALVALQAFPRNALGRLSWGKATALDAARALVRRLPLPRVERPHAAAAR